MSTVTVAWSMIAASCLTMGFVYFTVWLRGRAGWVNLCFATAAVSVAALAGIELLLMHADSVATYALLQRWGHVPVFVIIVSMVWFVHLYFQVGARWVVWLIIAWRAAVLGINFLGPGSINFREILELLPYEMLGEMVWAPIGVPNPWTRFAEAGNVVLALFVLHACLSIWKRNDSHDRRRALVIGTPVVMFILVSTLNGYLMHSGLVPMPYFLSPAFMVIIIAMAYELGGDLRRVATLARQLGDSTNRLELAAEAAELGFWQYDPKSGRFELSDQLRRMCGFASDDLVSFETWLARVHPDDQAEVAARAMDFFAGKGPFKMDYRLSLPSGEIRWHAGQTRETAQTGSMVHGAVLDVTLRHRDEHERTQLREELAHASRVTMLGQLASSLAHELSQPLGAILRNAETAELLMQADPLDGEELRAIVSDIRRDDQRAGEVISKLRGLLKQHSIELRPLELPRLVEGVMTLVRAEAIARGVRTRVEFGPSSPLVLGDPVHLQQLLLNLLINGLDAAQHAQHREKFVYVSTRMIDERLVEVAVGDSGPGVAPELESRIFDPFFTTKSSGMGIGLSICRAIVEAHGGHIWFDSGGGQSHAFRFTLRTADEPRER